MTFCSKIYKGMILHKRLKLGAKKAILGSSKTVLEDLISLTYSGFSKGSASEIPNCFVVFIAIKLVPFYHS